MNDTEIEIQVNVENSKPLIDFLEKNADFQKENHQIGSNGLHSPRSR